MALTKSVLEAAREETVADRVENGKPAPSGGNSRNGTGAETVPAVAVRIEVPRDGAVGDFAFRITLQTHSDLFQ
jgi:hypothetical protein